MTKNNSNLQGRDGPETHGRDAHPTRNAGEQFCGLIGLASAILLAGMSAAQDAPPTQPAATSAPATASAPASQPAAEVKVRYIETALISHDDENLLLRGAFEIVGQANQWYGVYFTLTGGESTASRPAGGREVQKLWNNLFLPDGGRATWSDVRVSFAWLDVRGLLGKGRQTVIDARCGVWDYASGRIIEGDAPAALRLVITTDSKGKVTKVEARGDGKSESTSRP